MIVFNIQTRIDRLNSICTIRNERSAKDIRKRPPRRIACCDPDLLIRTETNIVFVPEFGHCRRPAHFMGPWKILKIQHCPRLRPVCQIRRLITLKCPESQLPFPTREDQVISISILQNIRICCVFNWLHLIHIIPLLCISFNPKLHRLCLRYQKSPCFLRSPFGSLSSASYTCHRK